MNAKITATLVGLAFATLSGCIQPSTVDNSSVKVQLEKGHGSATHIGGGFFITAAHVVTNNETTAIITETGRAGSADVLWINKKYDVALMHSDIDSVASSDIDCRDASIGEEITLKGNPLGMEHVTTWGRVAGNPMNAGIWEKVVPFDGAAGPGMSGGGAFDNKGNLIGIVIGSYMARAGMSQYSIGIPFIVPSSVICMLLGR